MAEAAQAAESETLRASACQYSLSCIYVIFAHCPSRGGSVERKLAAILAADVVGYSSLMARDERRTFDRLKTIRRDIFEPGIATYRGRVFKVMGDGLLAEFPSVAGAVECAVELQRALREREPESSDDLIIQVRIGINLGEIIVEGGDRYGDGVNVACRLQDIAEPGGICVSEKVFSEVDKLLDFSFKSLGEQRLKNIPVPVRTYNVDWNSPDPKVPHAVPVPLPAKPSLAVLPFSNLSPDTESEYFADGLVEELITSLSKISGLFVIARNSSFAYKGKATDVRRISADLGVRYIIEGSVRRSSERLRITAQLIEGRDAIHIWADTFEGSLRDIFDLQDQLTESIVGAVEPTLRRAEIDHALRKRPGSLGSYDLFLRALPHVQANTAEDTDKAITLLLDALHLDDGFATAHGYAAWGYEQRFLRGGFDPADRKAALTHANKALELGRNEPQALALAAFVLATITHDYGKALGALDQALRVNRNSALAYGFRAMVNMFGERYPQACDDAAKALRLSPFDPMNYHSYLALAWVSFFTEKFEAAARYSLLGLQASPQFSILHTTLVASYARLGQKEEAQAAFLRLMEVAPNWSMSEFLKMNVVRPQLMQRFSDAFRMVHLLS